jgi:hypothetical protein
VIYKYYGTIAPANSQFTDALINNICATSKDAADIYFMLTNDKKNGIFQFNEVLLDLFTISSFVVASLKAITEDGGLNFFDIINPPGAPPGNPIIPRFPLISGRIIRFALNDPVYSKVKNLNNIITKLFKVAIPNYDRSPEIHNDIIYKIQRLMPAQQLIDVKNLYVLHLYLMYKNGRTDLQRFLLEGVNQMPYDNVGKGHAYFEILAHFIKLSIIQSPDEFRENLKKLILPTGLVFISKADVKVFQVNEFNVLLNVYLEDIDVPMRCIFKEEDYPKQQQQQQGQSQQQQQGSGKRRSRKFTRK